MSTYQLSRTNSFDKNLRRMILLSVLFHIGIFIIFWVRIVVFPDSEPLIYQAAMRVDIVGLPEKQIEPPSPAPVEKSQTPAPVKEEVKPIEKPVQQIKKTPDKNVIDLKKKQSKALEQLKAFQALEEELKKEKANEKKQRPIRGNVLAAGTSLRGLNKLDYQTYIGDIDVHVKQNWQLPEWLAKSNLRARVLVKIDDKGNLIKKELIQSSNNSTYDSLVLEAIDKSSPFPAPPDKFVNIVGIDGIIFQFPN